LKTAARSCLVAILIGGLVNAPAFGAPRPAAASRPAATVMQAQAALLDRSVAAAGSTVYAGDTLETDGTGSLRLRSGAAQLYMMSASATRLEETPSGIRVSLLHGTAGFSSGAEIVELDTPNAIFRSRPGQPAHGRVSMISADQFVVTSIRGAFDIEVDGQTQTVPDGLSYRLTIVPDAQQGEGVGTPGNKQSGSGTIATRRTHKKFFLTAITVLSAGAGYYFGQWAYHEITESPDKPNDD